ncbi:MAG: hypothetical protein AB2770_17950 [Candidatus Thiodiazotropha taylori]
MFIIHKTIAASGQKREMILERPTLNYFAGWKYLIDSEYRKEMREYWKEEPGFIVGLQLLSGAASVLFPLIIAGLLGIVLLHKL